MLHSMNNKSMELVPTVIHAETISLARCQSSIPHDCTHDYIKQLYQLLTGQQVEYEWLAIDLYDA